MVIVVASRARTLPVQQWPVFDGKIETTRVGHSTAQERTAAVEFPGLGKTPTEADRRLLLPWKAGAPARIRGEAVDIVLMVNIAFSANRVPTYVQLQRISYNEKGNLRSYKK